MTSAAESGTPAPPQWPTPLMNSDTAFFWEGGEAGELRVQRCTACGTLRHPPGPCCPSCLSFDWDFAVASGRGTVVSFVVCHYPPIPRFDPPYVVVLVELEEGTRVVGNMRGATSDDVEIGMPVVVDIVEVSDTLSLPMWRAADVSDSAHTEEKA